MSRNFSETLLLLNRTLTKEDGKDLLTKLDYYNTVRSEEYMEFEYVIFKALIDRYFVTYEAYSSADEIASTMGFGFRNEVEIVKIILEVAYACRRVEKLTVASVDYYKL